MLERSTKKKILQNKWVYRVKYEVDGTKMLKVRLEKGFGHKKGINCIEIFAIEMTSIRIILSIVVVKDLYLEQLNPKTTFLYGDLEEEICMQQLEGFEVKGKENMVCRLKRSLYRLKQTPMQ